jgi:hypothetical protein
VERQEVDATTTVVLALRAIASMKMMMTAVHLPVTTAARRKMNELQLATAEQLHVTMTAVHQPVTMTAEHLSTNVDPLLVMTDQLHAMTTVAHQPVMNALQPVTTDQLLVTTGLSTTAAHRAMMLPEMTVAQRGRPWTTMIMHRVDVLR